MFEGISNSSSSLDGLLTENFKYMIALFAPVYRQEITIGAFSSESEFIDTF